MVLVVFRSRLAGDHSREFQELGNRMKALAEGMPGFISYKVFIADDEERCSLIEFDSLENLSAWRNHPEHLEAQEAGRDRFYLDYSLQITEPQRESRFER